MGGRNRISYRVIGRKWAGSPDFVVSVDGLPERSKPAIGGDTSPHTCICETGPCYSSDWQAVLYDSAVDEPDYILESGAHTVTVRNPSPENIYLDAFEVVSESPVRFLDGDRSGGRVVSLPLPPNDWYIELTDAEGRSGYIAWVPDKTLLQRGPEARFPPKTSGHPGLNARPPQPVVLKLYGENYGVKAVTDGSVSVPPFSFAVEYYPYDGDHGEASRIWERIIKWRPRVASFAGTSSTIRISVNEIGIELDEATEIRVIGIDDVGELSVLIEVFNQDIIVMRSNLSIADARISWKVLP